MKRGKMSVERMLQFSFIMERELTDVKPADSFFTIYEEFCRQVLYDNWDLLNSSYASWIRRRLKKRSTYRSFKSSDTDKSFEQKLKKDALLAIDIRDNGLKRPIHIRSCSEDGFFDLDGAHRLIIHKVLGKDKIDFECKKELYELCFTGMKKWIENLEKGDFS